MKASARPSPNPIKRFFQKVKKETFSFIGFSMSLFVLLLNTATNYLVPSAPTGLSGEVQMYGVTVSSHYLYFTFGLIFLSVFFLMAFVYEWGKDLKL